MTKPNPERAGKMLVHDQGKGAISDDDIQRRARELALIDGHREVREEDQVEASRELGGESLPASVSEDADSMDSLSRDPSDPPVHRGRQVPDLGNSDEQPATERLVIEGVEEAQHDQMLAARRKRTT